MTDRFFVYSKEHNVPIRLLVQETPGGKMQYLNALIVAWDEENIYYIRPRKSDMGKPPRFLSRSAILSCDYARGDHGDTLQFMEEYTHD